MKQASILTCLTVVCFLLSVQCDDTYRAVAVDSSDVTNLTASCTFYYGSWIRREQKFYCGFLCNKFSGCSLYFKDSKNTCVLCLGSNEGTGMPLWTGTYSQETNLLYVLQSEISIPTSPSDPSSGIEHPTSTTENPTSSTENPTDSTENPTGSPVAATAIPNSLQFNSDSYVVYGDNEWSGFGFYYYSTEATVVDTAQYTIEITFSTTSTAGIIFFACCPEVSNPNLDNDFIAGQVQDGRLRHVINNGDGQGFTESAAYVNDGKIHVANFTKMENDIGLCLDGTCFNGNTIFTPGGMAGLRTNYYVGGVPSAVKNSAQTVISTSESLIGCIYELKVNDVTISAPTASYGVSLCT